MSSTTAANIERVAFISLGCPKNLVDSEQMLGTVREAGFTVVSSDDPADAIVVNTCGFFESSKEESLQVIREAIADAIGRSQAGGGGGMFGPAPPGQDLGLGARHRRHGWGV